MVSRVTVLVALTLLAASASAQTRFGLQVQGGAIAPMSAYVHTELPSGTSVTAGERITPRLVDQHNSLGFQLGTTFLFGGLEIRYTFHRMGWDREVTLCEGTGEAVVMSTGEVDDSTVTYADCVERSAGLGGQGLASLTLHAFSLGYRAYLVDAGRLQLYGVGAGGLGVSSYTHRHDENSVLAHVAAGVGSDLAITEDLSISVEGRYNLFLNGPPSRRQAAANRELAVGGNALTASVDAFHAFTVSLGVRLDFR